MSTTIDKLRAARDKAAALLQDAETRAAEETAAIRERNTARRLEFWKDAAERCKTAMAAERPARAAVVDAVAAGNMTAAFDLYGDYRRTLVESEAIVSAARAGTAHYIVREPITKQDGPITRITGHREVRRELHDYDGAPTGDYRTAAAPGVPARYAPRPATFDELATEGHERMTKDHHAAFRADYLAPLNDTLEPTP